MTVEGVAQFHKGEPRFGGTHIIHWSKNAAYEGSIAPAPTEGKVIFESHDHDKSKEIPEAEVFSLGEPWERGDRVWAYWNDRVAALFPGKVVAVGPLKSDVVFDDGDRGIIPNRWIHKMVKGTALQKGEPRFGGKYIIHWRKNHAYEGSVTLVPEGKVIFRAHDGDEREIPEAEVFSLGEPWGCGDRVWAYWTEEAAALNPGKVVLDEYFRVRSGPGHYCTVPGREGGRAEERRRV